MANSLKRATAYKLCIKDIIDGSYVRSEQNPSYLLTKDGRKVSRVNLIAVLLEKVEDSLWILEDESGRVTVRSFNEMPSEFINGDVVLVIGNPREFGGEKYLIPEIIKRLSYSWLKLRSIEIGQNIREVYQEEAASIVNDEKLSFSNEVYDMIKSYDKGEGVDFSILVEKFGNKSENIISKLLEQGEIFEVKPGRLKVLE